MGTEIERKFLVGVDNLPKKLPKGELYVQGYLATDPTVRIRYSEKGSWITVKGPGRMKRGEWEYKIPNKDAKEMLKLCKTKLRKIRRYVRYVTDVWHVDEFLGPLKGLWLAEIELETKNQGFQFPPWVKGEVTKDPRYSNANLAQTLQDPHAKGGFTVEAVKWKY